MIHKAEDNKVHIVDNTFQGISRLAATTKAALMVVITYFEGFCIKDQRALESTSVQEFTPLIQVQSLCAIAGRGPGFKQ